MIKSWYILTFFWLLSSGLLFPHLSGAANLDNAIKEAKSAEITRLAKQGRHLEAVRAWLALDKADRSDELKVYVAESAWAVGDVWLARSLWDELESDVEIDSIDRARILLSRGVMEFQENSLSIALDYAERAEKLLEPSELQAQVQLLAAEVLKEQGNTDEALLKLQDIEDHCERETAAEAKLMEGQLLLKQGQYQAARKALARADLLAESWNAHEALIEVNLKLKNYERVLELIDEAQSRFERESSEDKVTYWKVQSLLELGQVSEAEGIVAELGSSSIRPYMMVARGLLEYDLGRQELMGQAGESQDPGSDQLMTKGAFK